MITLSILLIFNLILMLSDCSNSGTSFETYTWTLENTDNIGGYQPSVLGDPTIIEDKYGYAVYFNGKSDGLIIPVNPVAGWDSFTVEVLFRPDSGGLPEQRFIHFQDMDNNRGLIETRLTPDGNWSLDTFLYNDEKKSGLTLIDRKIQHSCDEWYWAALVYNGSTMSHYVNGIKELDGNIEFGPMTEGEISVGVRLNQVHWFKGAIRELRFHSRALDPEDLQRP